jgi:CoA:oxalate CoA-transferase
VARVGWESAKCVVDAPLLLRRRLATMRGNASATTSHVARKAAMAEMAATYPLEGVRVLDLSRVLSGPYSGRMLSDLGADVVKVEPPEGDVSRNWGHVIAGLSGYYTQQNAGKRDVCIDLRRAGAPALLHRLAGCADVLIENFRPGVMQQYGLAYPELSANHERLIMLSISGYGQHGPDAARPAYAAVVHAEAGLLQREAELSNTKPRDIAVSVADMNAGLHGLAAVLAALFQRERSGRGQHIDLAMIDSMLATDDHVHLALDDTRLERAFNNQVWEATFGHIVVAGDFRYIFRRLVECCGLVDPTPKDAPLSLKISLRHQAVQDFFRSFANSATLAEALARADLAWGEVRSSVQAVATATVQARAAVASVPDRAGGMRRVIQSPYRFSAAESGVRGPAPFRGEHNREVLQTWLGCSDQEVSDFEQAQVLLREAHG